LLQLISPVNDGMTLLLRQQAVGELLAAEPVLLALRGLLPKLIDVDGLLSAFVAAPHTATPRTARVAIDAVIALKHTLAMLPQLAACLQTCGAELLSSVAVRLADARLDALRGHIDAIITEDTVWSKSAAQRRQQECFAVRPGIDGNLDAVRKVGARGGLCRVRDQ
jgi:DNA mismatch repair protein MSH4